MKVLVDGKEQERQVDHQEQRFGTLIDIPVTKPNEELIWTMASAEPEIVTVRQS